MRFVCAHCSTPLPTGARSCDRCGAPVHGAGIGAGASGPVLEDRWRGFRVGRPADWRVLYPPGATVCFESPGRDAWIELTTLPPDPVVDAVQQARLLVGSLPDVELRAAGDHGPTQAALAYRTPTIEGRVHVRLSPAGCVAVIARRRRESAVDLEVPTMRLLESLGPIEPIAREPFVCPHEQSFRLQRPRGWRVDSTIAQTPGGRHPMCRVWADPSGQTLLAIEPEIALFVDVPDAPAPKQGGGFFATLGRLASEAGKALATPMGHAPMPFAGLGPAAERHFLPKIERFVPGTKLVAFQAYGPTRGDLRVAYPNGTHCVFRLEGQRFPDPMVPNRWIATLSSWYQAPAEVFEMFEPIFRGIADSFEPNPHWRAAENQRQAHLRQLSHQQHLQTMQQIQASTAAMTAAHHQNMQTIHQMGAASTASHQANMTAMDQQMASWQSQQASTDAQAAGWHAGQARSDDAHAAHIDAIREVTPYAARGHGGDPVAVEVSSHHEAVWQDPTGQLFGGNWHLDVPSDWTELKPLKR